MTLSVPVLRRILPKIRRFFKRCLLRGVDVSGDQSSGLDNIEVVDNGGNILDHPGQDCGVALYLHFFDDIRVAVHQRHCDRHAGRPFKFILLGVL